MTIQDRLNTQYTEVVERLKQFEIYSGGLSDVIFKEMKSHFNCADDLGKSEIIVNLVAQADVLEDMQRRYHS